MCFIQQHRTGVLLCVLGIALAGRSRASPGESGGRTQHCGVGGPQHQGAGDPYTQQVEPPKLEDKDLLPPMLLHSQQMKHQLQPLTPTAAVGTGI